MTGKELLLFEVLITHEPTGFRDIKYIKALSERQALVIADGIISREHGDLAPYHEFEYKANEGVHILE